MVDEVARLKRLQQLTQRELNNEAASSGSPGTMGLGSTGNVGVTTPYGRSPCRNLDIELAGIMNYSDAILNNDDVNDKEDGRNLKSTGVTEDDYKEGERRSLFHSKDTHDPNDYDSVI